MHPFSNKKSITPASTSFPVSYEVSCTVDVILLYPFDSSRRGKAVVNSSRDKNEGAYRSGEGGEEPALWPQI